MPGDAGETVRRAARGDIPALIALFREVFGQERDPGVWEWKFFDEDHLGASFVCVAGDRIVAHCGGTPVRFRDGRAEYTAFQSVDFMSSPTYAGGIGGGGVFVRTVQEFFRQMCDAEKAPLVYGFPGERHRLLGERLLSYRPVEAVVELTVGGAESGGSLSELTERSLTSFESHPNPVGAVRDAGYLRWRYLRHPVHRYQYLAVKASLFGPKVASILRESESCFYLMEIGGDVSESGLRSLAKALGKLGKPVRGWFPLQHPAGVNLQRAGFSSATRDHYLECRFFKPRPHPRPGEFYYTLGDYDVY